MTAGEAISRVRTSRRRISDERESDLGESFNLNRERRLGHLRIKIESLRNEVTGRLRRGRGKNEGSWGWRAKQEREGCKRRRSVTIEGRVE
jgi:hypothetical protein